ncbi:hypothetical protein GPA25_07700 [Aromatoleum diolicum]|uniref:UvrABC system protein A n=1 Tax=Aromatoleum diolicum TaxID=75796 RepID=A0ABX1Q8F6_9RHOO|nr:hypothetical protein [Aromatoleum diolicum]NMG74644.1 hypothetical protein [Aromatoleum diolicum]
MADWLIELGPEGGDGGGRIVAQGPVADVCASSGSHTARILGEFLASRAVNGGSAVSDSPVPQAKGKTKKGRKS